ncbi:MAG: NADH:ubiquinone oxidoreductase subunit J [Gammaproteobacteria bacterium]|nr:NADH:ubiquinone oxidoreductase subunit J [Gammaproteobacteria bacterium]
MSFLFFLFSSVLILTSLGIILSRNPVYSALFLVFSFLQSAMLWMLLEAEFLSMVLILVYVGAVMVLFLFVVMMLDIDIEALKKGFVKYSIVGVSLSLLVVFEITNLILFKNEGSAISSSFKRHDADYSNTQELGSVLYTEHVYAFELASIVLLLAIIAAITLTMRRRPGLRNQIIANQVSVNAKDRLKLVDIKPSSSHRQK